VQKALSDGSLGKKYSVIAVTTHEGVVSLSGIVETQKEKTQIGKAIAKMSGVRGVKNELRTSR
jgi:osmotically-inducible protein OsmY